MKNLLIFFNNKRFRNIKFIIKRRYTPEHVIKTHIHWECFVLVEWGEN